MKIAVLCSSSEDIDKRYLESSKLLLDQVFKRNNELVFGAMNCGIMGIAYKKAKQYNRNIIGISTEIYKDKIKELKCNKEILTKGINDRTNTILNSADIFLFLPGGIGTLQELLSVIEMKRDKEIDKPIIIYNETGFFDEFIQTLNTLYQERFANTEVKSGYSIVNDYLVVLELLDKYNNDNI